MEPLWRNDTGIERPFSAVAGVSCRGSSLPLQRVMTDFGADDAFGPGVAKLKEHYGVRFKVMQPWVDRFRPLLFRPVANKPPIRGWRGLIAGPTSLRHAPVTTRPRGV